MNEQDSGKALLVSLTSVLAFVGFAYGWFYYQDFRAIEERRSKALRSATIELAADHLDRESAGLALRQLQKFLASDPSIDDGEPPADEVIRLATRLQLALGKAPAAWDSIEAYVISPDSQAADLWLGAVASSALYARRGTEPDGLLALGLASRHHQATGEVESLFLATTLAYRISEIAAFIELREQLLSEHGDTRQGRLLAALGYTLGVHLSERIGFIGDQLVLAELASAGASDDRSLLAVLRISAANNSAIGDLIELETLEGEFEAVPAELQVAIAEAQVGRAGASSEDLQAGLRRVEQALEDYPSYLEARHVAAVIHYALSAEARATGDLDRAQRERALCQGRLRWLLGHAGPEDSRRANWRAMQR